MSDVPRRTVLIAVSQSWEGEFVAELSSSRRVEVVRRCADAAELVSAAAAGLGDFAVVGAGLRGLDRSLLADLATHGAAVLGVSERGDEGQERSLRQLGIGVVTRSDATCSQVEEALAALRETTQRSASSASGPPIRPTGPPSGPPHDVATVDVVPPVSPDLPLAPPGLASSVVPDTSAVAGTDGLPGEDLPLVPRSLLDDCRHAPRPHGGEGVTSSAVPRATTGDRPASDGPEPEPWRPRDRPRDQRGGRLVAVWGPAGAPGRSTVALGLASEAAERGLRALLVDADPYGGVQAQALSILDEGPGLVGAVRAADVGTLDVPALIGWCRGVGPGLSVLTGLPRPERWPELRAAPLAQVLGLTRAVADLIVVDCGFCLEDDEDLSYDTLAPRRNAATLTALAAADHVVVVGAGDPIGLQRLTRGLGDLDALTLTALRSVVVNRVRAGAIGRRPEAAIAAALRRFAGVEALSFIPEDRAALDRAVSTGRTLAECAPGSAARRALADLTEQISRGLAPSLRSRRSEASGRRHRTVRPWEAHRV